MAAVKNRGGSRVGEARWCGGRRNGQLLDLEGPRAREGGKRRPNEWFAAFFQLSRLGTRNEES